YQEWRDDATACLADEKILQAAEWIDADFRVRWVVPDTLLPFVEGMDVAADERWAAAGALHNARERDVMAVSPTVTLREGGLGFATYHPVSVEGRFDGFIVGVFNMETLMRSV